MHLLATTPVTPDGDATAVDLGQTPGEIVILSAADSELACLAAAQTALGEGAPSLRLANLLRLAHPLSVDLYADRIVASARLVVVRLLGGRAYWSYGVERLSAVARQHGVAIAFLPGDERADPELADWSTLPSEPAQLLWRYMIEGGADNARSLLRYAAFLIGRPTTWEEPRPVPRAGMYAPGMSAWTFEDSVDGVLEDRPSALVVFYRALFQSGDLAPINGLMEALEHAGLRCRSLYVTSLKDAVAQGLVAQALASLRPDVIVNATSFAAGDADPLAAAEVPVLQVVLSSDAEGGWRESTRGLSPRDLAMQVALTELDGRILTRAISFKAADPPIR